MKTTIYDPTYEQILVNIMRKLPHERILELINFARFLDFQNANSNSDECLDEEKWNQLLVQPKAKSVLREMAYEARHDYYAGKTTGITITEDGLLHQNEITSYS